MKKLLEDSDEKFGINKGRKWILTEDEAREIKDYILSIISQVAKETLPERKELGNEVGLDRLSPDAITRDAHIYGFNEARQQIIENYKKLGINLC